MNKQAVPKIGDKHDFFDDGKMRVSRHYVAEVIEVITPEEAKEVMITRIEYENDNSYPVTLNLYDIWREEVDSHRNSENFRVLGAGVENKPGAPWCYAEETDYFVKCSIPEYDKNDVWFVRHVDGGWFSIETVQFWMSGKLMPIEFNAEKYFEQQLKEWQEWFNKNNWKYET